MSTIFEKIIKRELPAEIVYENERIIAIKDLYPKAAVHLLIMPKKEFQDLQSVPVQDLPLIVECLHVAQILAERYNISKGYRLTTNVGKAAGQTIFHLHFHLMGGGDLAAFA